MAFVVCINWTFKKNPLLLRVNISVAVVTQDDRCLTSLSFSFPLPRCDVNIKEVWLKPLSAPASLFSNLHEVSDLMRCWVLRVFFSATRSSAATWRCEMWSKNVTECESNSKRKKDCEGFLSEKRAAAQQFNLKTLQVEMIRLRSVDESSSRNGPLTCARRGAHQAWSDWTPTSGRDSSTRKPVCEMKLFLKRNQQKKNWMDPVPVCGPAAPPCWCGHLSSSQLWSSRELLL